MIPYQSVHFVGVLTPEMASLAVYTASLNIRVTASHDSPDSIYLPAIQSAGVIFYDMYAQLNITKTVELVIISRYHDMRHVEADTAQRLKIPVLTETDYVKLLSENSRRLAVLGEYDSRLIVSFLMHVWKQSHIPNRGLIQTVPVDDNSPPLEVAKESDWFVLPLTGFKRDAGTYEADFLSFESEIAIIPNILYDYPELNTTLDDVYQSYYAFAKRVPRRGLIIGNSDYSRMKRLRGHLADRHIETYGFDRDASWQIREVDLTTEGSTFSLFRDRSLYGPFEVPYPGESFIYAGAAVVIASLFMDIKPELVGKALKSLVRYKRYFEKRIDKEGRVIIDDQADHPEQIGHTLRTIRKIYPSKKIWCLYQPGSYLRTKSLFNELQKELSLADFVYLADIKGYPKEKSEGLNIRHFIADMKRKHSQTYYFDDSIDMSGLLSDRVASTDLIVTLGVEGICQKAVAPLFTTNG